MRTSVRSPRQHIAWFVAFVMSPQGAAAEFLRLGSTIPQNWVIPTGTVGFVPNALSGDGQTVVGRILDPPMGNTTHAATWTDVGGVASFGDFPGATETQCFRVSFDASVRIGYSSGPALGPVVVAWRWTAAAGFQAIGPGWAAGVSGDGLTMVGHSNSTSIVATVWYTPAASQPLPGQPLGGLALATSFDGQYHVGEVRVPVGNLHVPQPARWSRFGVGPIFVGPVGGYATATSANGSIVFGQCTPQGSGRVPFRWTEQTGWTLIGPASPALDMEVVACSANGQVAVVNGSTGTEPRRPILWDSVRGLRFLDLELQQRYGIDIAGWQLGTVAGISADGRTIAGFGVNPQGAWEGWVVHGISCLGDTNGDGIVDFADLNLILATYGARVGELLYIVSADLNGDGAIDFLDLNLVLGQFGSVC